MQPCCHRFTSAATCCQRLTGRLETALPHPADRRPMRGALRVVAGGLEQRHGDRVILAQVLQAPAVPRGDGSGRSRRAHPEGRLNFYKILGLRVVMSSDGGVEASGRFVNKLSVCTPEPAQACYSQITHAPRLRFHALLTE